MDGLFRAGAPSQMGSQWLVIGYSESMLRGCIEVAFTIHGLRSNGPESNYFKYFENYSLTLVVYKFLQEIVYRFYNLPFMQLIDLCSIMRPYAYRARAG